MIWIKSSHDTPAPGTPGASTDSRRLAGAYTGRIRDKPAELPVQQVETKVELIFNLKTAKVFGVTAPRPLIALCG